MAVSSRTLVALFVAAVAVAAPLTAQKNRAPDAAKVATIRRLLDLTRSAQLSIRAMELMVPAQRAANPQIPAEFWDAFLARAKRDVNQLVDSLVPIYGNHFSQAELDELVRFYQSPIGRRLTDVQPLITQESVEVGQRWGAIIGRQVAESLGAGGRKAPNE